MKPITEMLSDIDTELTRSKMFLNDNKYHHGTAIAQVTQNYRLELKRLRKLMHDDLHLDGVYEYPE